MKWAKIILLLQFSWSPSVCWPYIQSLYWYYWRAGPACTECECECRAPYTRRLGTLITSSVRMTR